MNRNLILTALAGTIALAGGTVAIAQQPAATPTATPMKHRGGHMMRMFDANKDGTLTRAEATAAADARFAMLDTDRNGTVTAAEFQASRDQMRQKMNERRAAAGKAPREPRAGASDRPGRAGSMPTQTSRCRATNSAPVRCNASIGSMPTRTARSRRPSARPIAARCGGCAGNAACARR